jgi:flagellar operon protein
MKNVNIPGYIPNIKIGNLPQSEIEKEQSKVSGRSFDELLREKSGEVKFSAHAQKRIDERKISIDSTEMKKLQSGVEKLKEKGGRESVILMDDKAFVVSVKNNTVVTIMDEKSIKDNVFTNIDSMMVM